MDSQESQFNKTFWYISGMSLLIMGYVIGVTFLPIPETNQRFADIALAFLLGVISTNASFLTGGNPALRKMPPDKTAPASFDMNLSATSNTEPVNEPNK